MSAFLHLFPRKAVYEYWKRSALKLKGQDTGWLGFSGDIHRFAFRKEDLFPLRELPFEDMQIPVPKNADVLLRTYYGPDYMTPAPEGKRSSVVPYRLDLGEGNLAKSE